MARSEARLQFGMWTEGLDGYGPHAKLTYAVLLTEDTITQCGVGRVCLEKWAQEASLSESELDKALDELQAGHPSTAPVVIDRHEVLVRTLIRHDKVCDQPFVLQSALAAAARVKSPLLRRVLAQELRKLPPKRPDGVSRAGRKIVYPDPHACADLLDPRPPTSPAGTLPEPFPNPSRALPEPFEKGSSATPNGVAGEPFENPSRRDYGSGSGSGSGSSTCLVGTTVSPDADATGTQPKTSRTTNRTAEPLGFAEWYAEYPRHEARAKAVAAYRSALGKRAVTPELLLAGARRYSRFVRADGRDPSKVAHPASWLNAERWTDEYPGTPDAPTNVADPDAAFTDIRQRGDAAAAARLAGTSYVVPAKPPSDPTDPKRWRHARAVEWIDAHADRIRDALHQRPAG